MSLYPNTPIKRKERYQTMKTAMWSERASFDSHWRELADFVKPRRIRLTPSDKNRGDKRNQNIINSTAGFSLRTLQSGMHAGLTSPARPWMKLTTPDPELAKFPPVKEWLHDVTQRMLDVFLQSNLYNALPICYGDLGLFGTHALAILEDEELFRAKPFAIGTYALGLDGRDHVCTFVREYSMSVRQIVEQFGVVPGSTRIDWGPISDTVKTQWDNGNYETAIDVTWVVMPNDEADPARVEARYLPFTSCYFESGRNRDNGQFLKESGFRKFPILGPRWDVTDGDTYGTDSPGMMALGDVKQLQGQERSKGKAIVKGVDPPMVAPASLRAQRTSILPGDVTYQDVREGMQGFKPAHEVRIDISHLTADIGEVQFRIQRAFFEDLFLMLARSDDRGGADRPTAREVEERHEEKLLALGPVLERTNDELLDPLVDRVFDIMDTAGLIPPPPDELDGVKLKVEYTSIMAQAQKLVGVVGQDRFVASVMPLVETGLVSRHKIVGNQLADNYGEMLGIDPRIIRGNDEADALAAEEAKQQQAAMAAENAAKLGQAVKAAGTTPMQGDTALNRVLGGSGAAAAAVGGPA